MPTETINIITRESGARVVKRRFDEIGNAADRATRGLFLMQRALFVIGGAGAITALTRQADALTNLENRLRLTTNSTEELENVQAQLFQTANNARSAFNGVSQIYTRTALSVKALGVSTADTIKFTERLAKATVISGASAQEANAALVQLGQGMASNRLSGDELRSILEQLPYVADVIAKHMGVTRGELRDLGADGKISAQIILDAFQNAGEEIDKVFAQTIPTIGQAFAVAGNNLKAFLDQIDDATGGSAAIASAIMALSENLDHLAGTAAVAGAVLLGLYGDKLLRASNAALGAQIAYSKAVQSGEIVLLNSAKAEELRTQHALRTAQAKNAAAQAEVANTNATIRGIQTRIADLNATRGQLSATLALIEAQKASQAYTVSNGRARLVATGQFVNQKVAQDALNASTKALIVTKRALASVDGQLALATGSLAIAQQGAAAASTAAATTSVALAGAQGAAAAQAAKATTIWGRFSLMFPILTANIRAAGAAFARFGAFIAANPFMVIITALTALQYAFMASKSTAEKVQATFDSLKKITDDLETSFDKTGRTTETFKQHMEGLGQSQILIKQLEATHQLEDAMMNLTRAAEAYVATETPRYSFMGGISESAQQVKDLTDELKNGEINVDSYAKKLDKIAVASGDQKLQVLAARVMDLSKTATTAEDNLALINAMLAELRGEATHAQRVLLGLEQGMRDFGSSSGAAATAVAFFTENISELKEAAEQRAKLLEAERLYRAAVDETNAAMSSGELTTLEGIGELAHLEKLFNQAKGEIDGTTEKLKEAEKAMAAYNEEAYRGTLTDLHKSLHDAATAFQEVRAQAIAAKAGPEELMELFKSYDLIRQGIIDAHFKKQAEDEAKALEDVTKALRDYNLEASLIGSSDMARQLAEANQRFNELKAQAEEAGIGVEGLTADYHALRAAIIQSFETTNLEKIEETTSMISSILSGLKDNLGDAKDGFDAATMSVADMTRNVEALSVSGANLAIQESTAQVKTALDEMGLAVDNFLEKADHIALPDTVFIQISAMKDALDQNTLSAEEFITRLDRMAASSGNPAFMELVRVLKEKSGAASDAEDNINILEAAIRFLSGTASSADRILLGLASAMDQITGSANAAASAVDFFTSKIPALKEAARIQGELAQAQAHLEAGKAEITARVGKDLSIDQAAAEIANLTDLYNQATSEIDGSAEALRKVTKELDGYSTQADIASHTGLSRSLRQAEIEYNNLRDAAVEAGAGQAELNKLEKDYQTIRSGIIRDDKKKGGGRQKKDFAGEMKDIQDEIDLLQLAGRERRIYAGILKIEDALKRKLSASEKEHAEEMLRALDIAKARADILDQLRGPQEALMDRQSALNDLFREGTITLQEYKQGLKDVQLGLDQVTDTISSGFRSSINDAIMTSNEFGRAMGDTIVNASGDAADAIVEFVKTGKFSIRELFFELFAQLFKLAAQQVILRLVASLLGIPVPPVSLGGLGTPAPVPGHAEGASYMPTGPGSTDTQLMVFKKRPDERVDILTPAQQHSQKKRVLHEVFGTADVETITSGGLNRMPTIGDGFGRAGAGSVGGGAPKEAADIIKPSTPTEIVLHKTFAKERDLRLPHDLVSKSIQLEEVERTRKSVDPEAKANPIIQDHKKFEDLSSHDVTNLNKAIYYGAFARGGTIHPSGPGNTDTQLVSFDKRPDERVEILTPAQQQESKENKKRDLASNDTQNQESGTNIINVLDPSIVGRYLQTSDGRRVLINILGEEGVLGR